MKAYLPSMRLSERDIQTEIDRLIQVTHHLAAAQGQAQQTIESLQSELAKRKMYAEIVARFAQDDWSDFKAEEYTIPAAKLLADGEASPRS